MSATQTVTPLVSTKVDVEKKIENKAITFVNNIPDELEQLDVELNAGFTLQSAVPNESDFRVGYLVDAVIASNKATARANVASYERAIDKMAGLTCYRKTHTREAVEAAFLQTRDGKIMAEIKKCSAEYLEAHK